MGYTVHTHRGVRTPDFAQVKPTPEELAQWRADHPHQHPPYRSRCRDCGRRIWHSGYAVAAHRRHCKGPPAGHQHPGPTK